MEWIDRHRARLVADINQRDHVVSVQLSYDPGWRAVVGGEPRRVFSDELELLVVDPECSGRCVIELIYDGGMEARILRWLNWVVALWSVVWVSLDWRRGEKVSN